MLRLILCRTRLLIAISVISLSVQAGVSTPGLAELVRNFNYYWELNDYSHARDEAEKIVRSLEGSNKSPLDFASALYNLAAVQHMMGLHLESERNFKRSIGLVESHMGQYSAELRTKLTRLGALYFETQRYELAKETFQRAQHITHRNNGVYALEQLELLDWITRVSIKTGEAEDADVQQKFYYRVNLKNYGEDDPRMVPAMNRSGEWLTATGQFSAALDMFRKAIVLLEEIDGSERDMLRPLRGISSVLYLKGVCCAEKPLQEVLDSIRRDPTADRADEIDAMIHIADMNMMNKNRKQAQQIYQSAWNKLASEDGTNNQAESVFGTPVLLGVRGIKDVVAAFIRTDYTARLEVIYPDVSENGNTWSISFGSKESKRGKKLIGGPLPLCYPQVMHLTHAGSEEELQAFYMDLDFTVTDAGNVAHVSIIDSNVPHRLKRYVTNLLRKFRYRPRLIEGEAVDTDMTIRQTFHDDGHLDPVPRESLNRTIADSNRAASLGCQLLAMVTGI